MRSRSHPNSFGSRRLRCFPYHRWLPSLALILTLTLTAAAQAQGGPPFRTDDPETPGNKHLEVNIGFIADRNPAAGDYDVPNFDFNYGLGDRLQLKYEIPIALAETRPQPATLTDPAISGRVIGGIGESLLGIKWRFYEHRVNDPYLKNRFGTGLLGVFGPHRTSPEHASNEVRTGGEAAAEPVANFSISTYPQLYLDNPTRSVSRGLVVPGPNFYLPIEVNGRIGPIRYNGDFGYNFGNRSLAQSWNRGLLIGHEFSERTEAYIEIYDLQDATRVRPVSGDSTAGGPKLRETTLGIGGRQALNKDKTFNLLLMAGRSFQAVSTSAAQPSWIAYVGFQVILGPKETVTPQVEQKLPDEAKP